MAVVLVGRIVDIRHESWQSMPAALKAAVRQGLWHNFTHETDPELVRKLSHAVARASEGWKDLVAASIGLLGSTNDQARQVGVFFLLEQMSEYSDELKSDPGRLLPVFQAALVDDMTLPVRCGALKALLSLLNHIETRAAVINGGVSSTKGGKGSAVEGLSPLAGLAVGSVGRVLEGYGQGQVSANEAQKVLELLVDTMEVASKFFTAQIEGILQFMMALGAKAGEREGGEENEEEKAALLGLKCAAVEVLLVCCKECPGTVRKVHGFPQAFLTLCMTLGATASFSGDVAAWGRKMDFEPEGESPEGSSHEEGAEQESVAAAAIYRLMQTLGGKTMLPIAMILVPEWLGTAGPEHWAQRRMSLLVVEALVDYCPKAIKPSYGQMLKTAVDFTQDAHPRVAAEAFHLVNILCAKFPELVPQGTYLQFTLPALHAIIGDSSRYLRLRGIAVRTLAVLLSACEERLPASTLTPYMGPLLTALISCLQSDMPPELQETTLDAVAAMATVAQGGFVTHYQGVMGGLKGILSSSSSSAAATGQAGNLRDKAIECVGILGSAVGRRDKGEGANFATDATEVMQMLVGQLQGAVPGQVSFERLGPATGVVCAALGDLFLPFVPTLVGLLAQTTKLDLGFAVQDVGEEVEEGVTAAEDGKVMASVVDLKGMGGKKLITINTYAVQEVEAALDTLDKYARVLGANFVEPAEALLPLLGPLIKCPHSDVRSSAALCAAAAFDCIVEAVKAGQRDAATAAQPLLLQILPVLVDQMDKERQPESRQYLAQAIRDVLRACAESGGVDEATGMLALPVTKLCHAECMAVAVKVRESMLQSLIRRSEIEQQFEADDEMEDEDYDALLEAVGEEAAMMSDLTDCMGYLIKAEREAFIPIFDAHVVPILQALLSPPGPGKKNPATLTAVSVCLFDDMIEYASPASHKYLPTFLPLLSAALERAMPPDTNTAGGKKIGNEESEEGEDEEGDLAVLRQACVYGVTQICKHAPDCLDKALVSFNLLPRLIALLRWPHRMEEVHRGPTENVVSALLSICQGALTSRLQEPAKLVAQNKSIPHPSDLLSLCLAHLPLTEDVQEARTVHRQLADMLSFPPSFATLTSGDCCPLLIQALAEIVASAKVEAEREEEASALTVEPKVAAMLAAMLSELPSKVSGEGWTEGWGRVNGETKKALQGVVRGIAN